MGLYYERIIILKKKEPKIKLKNIEIEWAYPANYYKALEHDLSSDIGLYQISRLFGQKETLLYIGIVKSLNRTFKQRLIEHKSWLDEYRGMIKVKFGVINKKQGLTINEELIEDIESVLIYEVEPFENTQKIQSYSINKDLKITNLGYREFLPNIISSSEHEDS